MKTGPFDNLAALAVFRDLDPNDWMEAMLARGSECDHLQLFAEWWSVQALAALSLILRADTGTPCAVLMVVRVPGQAGQAHAALLARSHARFRAPLARAAAEIRQGLPGWAAEQGLTRIEARSWVGHPTASRLLAGCGFTLETTLGGFGPGGAALFHQFAWTTGG